MQTYQDHVALRAIHIVEHAEHFHLHGLGFHALKDGIGYATHADMNLAYRDGRRSLRGIRFLRDRDQGEKQANGGECGNQFFHLRRLTGLRGPALLD